MRVAHEAMLNEVQKEIDIMVSASISNPAQVTELIQRLLRGHPNIVYLIDTSVSKIPTGGYEVFILMEFCPGTHDAPH